ncbi:hypothetical protein [Nocardioides sp. AE5]|uniref:hypothetical protein n=1 Tax=Nocardioides sp. AE5 TaxID=2962573 RepID=UPI0028817BC0|nr:hypothetical protein [Nocardioides sp. AE5]MDT0202166.1 hypothetical protein [Nocardioides sp. AE5]
MTGIDLNTEALRNHAADINSIATDAIADVVNAAGGQLTTMPTAFGIIAGPAVVPPLTGLSLAATGMATATSGVGMAIAGGVDGTAAMMELVEDELTKMLGGTPDTHGAGTSELGYDGNLVSTGTKKPWSEVRLVGPAFATMQSIADADGGFSWDVAIDGATFALDALTAVVDPGSIVFGAVAGFVLELIPPAMWFVDMLTGDPVAINGCSTTWINMGNQMRTASEDYFTSVNTVLGSWKDAGGLAYAAVGDAFGGFMGASGALCTLVGTAVTAAGFICATMRGIVIDMIGALIAWLVAEIAAGLAAASVTFGAALGPVITFCMAHVSMVCASIAGKIGKGMTKLAKLGEACGQNTTALRTAAQQLDDYSSSLKDLAHALRGTTPDIRAAATMIGDMKDLHKVVKRTDSLLGPILDPPDIPA